jgi:hypothetical protein
LSCGTFASRYFCLCCKPKAHFSSRLTVSDQVVTFLSDDPLSFFLPPLDPSAVQPLHCHFILRTVVFSLTGNACACNIRSVETRWSIRSLVAIRKIKNKKIKKQKTVAASDAQYWINYGAFYTLFNVLRKDDGIFFSCSSMFPRSFEELHSNLDNHHKRDTNMRRWIPAKERLAERSESHNVNKYPSIISGKSEEHLMGLAISVCRVFQWRSCCHLSVVVWITYWIRELPCGTQHNTE